MARWTHRERALMAALVFSYAFIFPVHLLMRAGSLPLPDGGGGGGGGGGMGAIKNPIMRTNSNSASERSSIVVGPGASDGGGSASSSSSSSSSSQRGGTAAPATPAWVTSGGGPTAHVAALTAHGGSVTYAFAVPIWTRVMGQPAPDDGPGRDAVFTATATATTTTTTTATTAAAATTGAAAGGGEDAAVNSPGGVDVHSALQKLRSTVLTQYRRHLHEFRAKSRVDIHRAKARDRGGEQRHGGVDYEEGAAVNNLFFEWQQARDVTMLNARAPCMDAVRRAAAEVGEAEDAETTRTKMRRCEEEALQGHWVELYASDEYKRVSAFIRNSLRSYMSALGLEGDAASRRDPVHVISGPSIHTTAFSLDSRLNRGGKIRGLYTVP